MDPNLYNAAMEGDFQLAQQIRDAEIGYQVTQMGNTVVHVAALHGRSHFMGEVLKITPALLCRQNKKDESALHIAANEGQIEVVRVLLESVVEDHDIKEKLIRMTDASGDTALHKAVRSQHLDIVKLLVKEDPEFEFPANHAQETPLYLAAESGFIDILREILESCKIPNYAAGPLRRTPLHAAVVQEHLDCARLLLQENKSLCEEPDEWGWYSLHYAVKLGLEEVVSDMLEWKKSLAYLQAGSENDWTTAIHIAASTAENENVIKELLEHCPDCWEMHNSRGQNALHVAALASSFRESSIYTKFFGSQVSPLLSSLKSENWGSLIDEPDKDGNTPLHFLARSWIDVPEELRSHPKAKKMSFNKDSLTPRDMYSRATMPEMIDKDVGHLNSGQFGRRCFEIKPQIAQEYDIENMLQSSYFKYYEKIYEIYVKNIMEEAQIHLVVATLIMTITFAAGFTLPGGLESDTDSPNKGMAILIRKTAFRAFVVSDAIAFACSSCAVLCYFFMAIFSPYHLNVRQEIIKPLSRIAAQLQFVAMSAVVIAFVTGMYATLAHSVGLAATVCVISCFFFLMLVGVIFFSKYVTTK